eukprot:433451_1
MAMGSVQQMIKYSNQTQTSNHQSEYSHQYNKFLNCMFIYKVQYISFNFTFQSIILHHKSIVLDIVTLIFIIMILIIMTPSSPHKIYPFLDWMNPNKLKEFKQSFYDLLDHNNDGIVNLTELFIGIQTQLDSSYIH